MQYCLYKTHVYTWRNQYVQARLISPPTHQANNTDCGFGFANPLQEQPYGVNLLLKYQVNSKHPYPDNYYETAGFRLYSERLIDLLVSASTKCEIFPAVLVDTTGEEVTVHRYYVFHSLEGTIDAMDEIRSEWAGSRKTGVPRLIIREDIVKRPLFVCDKIFVELMRNDLKESIRARSITGFDFLNPSRFRSGIYGSRPHYDD